MPDHCPKCGDEIKDDTERCPWCDYNVALFYSRDKINMLEDAIEGWRSTNKSLREERNEYFDDAMKLSKTNIELLRQAKSLRTERDTLQEAIKAYLESEEASCYPTGCDGCADVAECATIKMALTQEDKN